MDDTRWSVVSGWLDRLLAMDEDERSANLQRLAKEVPEVHAEIVALLDADRRAGEFLQVPAALYAADLWEDLGADDPLPQRLGPYEVRGHLGAGGMGDVFLGWDDRLERQVAIKQLPASWSHHGHAVQRFQREAKAVSKLDHPNICTVYDVGTDPNGRFFLVMAYYRGETLAQRLERGALSWDEAADIVRQVARGLAHAHRHGLVHRDIKPANLMLVQADDGAMTVKILDFGIAKSTDGTALTATEMSPGTPAYMAPEQRDGSSVDGRTDLWALGLVACEMVLGRRPGSAEWSRDAGRRGLRKALLAIRPAPPAQWVQTVLKMLAFAAGERPESADALLEDLQPQTSGLGSGPWRLDSPERRWVTWGMSAALVLVALAAWWWERGSFPAFDAASPADGQQAELADSAEAMEVPRLAVLPLEVTSTVAADGHLEDPLGQALAQLVRDQLAPWRELHVVSARHCDVLGDLDPSRREEQAAREGVAYLLSGSIDTVDGGWSLRARLVQTVDGRQLAALHRTATTRGEVLGLSRDLSESIRRSLALPAEQAVDIFAADFAADHPLAYEAFIEGLDHFVAYRMEAAEASWRRALELAPEFLMARYRLAHVLAVEGRTALAQEEIQRALEQSAEAPRRQRLYIEAMAAYIDRRLDDAQSLYSELCERYPYDTEARYLRAEVAFALRHFDQVLADADLLAHLEPERHVVWSLRGSAHLALGNGPQAVQDFTEFVRREPGSANGHHLLADAYRQQGELGLAAASYREALEADGQFYVASIALAQMLALDGQAAAAEAALQKVASDTSAAPRWRIDAAFELTHLQLAGGRFRQAIATIDSVRAALHAEGIRYPHGLTLQVVAHTELGQLDVALELAQEAVDRSDGVRTRYLVYLARVHLARGELDAVASLLPQIEAAALPPDNPDRTEDKAVAFLRGHLALADGDLTQAEVQWTRAVTLEGYAYATYRLHLGKLMAEDGRHNVALATLHRAMETPDTLEPRLDLLLDRHRARLRRAEVLAAMGGRDVARQSALPLLEVWQGREGLQDEWDRLGRLLGDQVAGSY